MRPLVDSLRSEHIAANVPPDNFTALGLGILCGDVAWPTSLDVYQNDLAKDSKQFPMFGPLGSNIWPCAFWPTHSQPATITSNGPSNILIVENRRDPATPYIGALGMHTALGQRSRLVSVDQGGHGVYLLTPNVCANNTVTAYFANGAFPSSDISCPANASTAAATQQTTTDQTHELAVREIIHRMRP